MKIGHLENKAAVSQANAERKSHPAKPAGAGAEASAKVELSDTVAKLAGGQTEGVFDAAKVDRISAAIRDGKFTVNAEAIADKLIANAHELLGTAKHR
jgi:negative regulator of flagellin synthesis FlgM